MKYATAATLLFVAAGVLAQDDNSTAVPESTDAADVTSTPAATGSANATSAPAPTGNSTAAPSGSANITAGPSGTGNGTAAPPANTSTKSNAFVIAAPHYIAGAVAGVAAVLL